ncbi:MAG: PEP-CTERM sorting domain-containing protein [Verrucomicrobiota bacterium]|nr:PEP-CTERM sorting domain-containing protein [Verrucomicrobiota bacterium]
MIKRLLAAAFGITASLTLVNTTWAVDYTEVGDAGNSYGTAQSTAASAASAGAPLNRIFGSLSAISDADIFVIYISNPAAFSATTVNSLTGATNLDTQLFLFDSQGRAVFGNDDDASGTTLGSTLPGGNAFGPQVAGIYYLGISLSGNDPINFASQLMFLLPSTSTEIRQRNPNAPGSVFNFDPSRVTSTTGGAYQIDLIGAQTAFVPEPTTIALAVFGAIGIAAVARKRRA